MIASVLNSIFSLRILLLYNFNTIQIQYCSLLLFPNLKIYRSTTCMNTVLHVMIASVLNNIFSVRALTLYNFNSISIQYCSLLLFPILKIYRSTTCMNTVVHVMIVSVLNSIFSVRALILYKFSTILIQYCSLLLFPNLRIYRFPTCMNIVLPVQIASVLNSIFSVCALKLYNLYTIQIHYCSLLLFPNL